MKVILILAGIALAAAVTAFFAVRENIRLRKKNRSLSESIDTVREAAKENAEKKNSIHTGSGSDNFDAAVSILHDIANKGT